MMRDAFKAWLIANAYSSKAISNYLAQCSWVEKNCGDLDHHVERNRVEVILSQLTLRPGETNSLCGLISGDCSKSLATYRSSVNCYTRFRANQNTMRPRTPMRPQQAGRTAQTLGREWPKWSLPDEEEQIRLAAMAVPYLRFLHPDIVRAVVEDNQRHGERWAPLMRERGVDPSLYLWHKSSCAFPGIRRYAGSSEIAQFRGRMEATGVSDALKLDDNSYPKAIWSFVFRGKPFQNQGPSGYSLAHLADHKTYKNRAHIEFDGVAENPNKAVFGLYTCVSNTVYVPENLIRLTDFSFSLRNLVQRKTLELYGGFCNLLPSPLSFRGNDVPAWSLNSFRWSEPVGTPEHLTAFLEYRQDQIEKLLTR